MKKLLATLAIGSFLLLGAVGMSVAGGVTLIKPDEARLPAASASFATRGITRGPGIKMVSPDPAVALVKAPFDLMVSFEPRGGAKIDLASVKVTYLKANSVDLLPRVKPGLTEGGITLAGAQVPPGEHQIQISLQDSEGRQSNAILLLNVAK